MGVSIMCSMIQKYLLLIVLLALIPLSGYASDDDYVTPVPTNEEVIADETTRLMLMWLDERGTLRPGETAAVPQPVYIDVSVPARVRSRLLSNLISAGVRVAAEPSRYHTIRIQWESDNLLVEKRGGMSQRTLRADIFFTWLDSEKEIQNTWQSSFVWEDDIPTDQLPLVTGTWEPASFHHRKETARLSFLRRIAEPAVITGAIAVTIYLLYNVRS